MPLINYSVQEYVDRAHLGTSSGDSRYINYTNLFTEIFNTVISFVLSISLNILVIYASARHVHLTSHLRQA
jgi:hypothetical protein